MCRADARVSSLDPTEPAVGKEQQTRLVSAATGLPPDTGTAARARLAAAVSVRSQQTTVARCTRQRAIRQHLGGAAGPGWAPPPDKPARATRAHNRSTAASSVRVWSSTGRCSTSAQAAWSTTRPARIIATTSAMVPTTAVLWVMNRRLRPKSRCRSDGRFRIGACTLTGSADVSASQRSAAG